MTIIDEGSTSEQVMKAGFEETDVAECSVFQQARGTDEVGTQRRC
jgi:hypothetical protein